MNDVTQELDALIGNPQPITLTEERRKPTMDTKLIGKFAWSLLAVAGLAAVGYGAIWLFSPTTLGTDPLEALEVEEAGRVREILAYCGRGTRDPGTCLLWVASYRELVTGEPQKIALFDRESLRRIAEMKRHRNLEAEAEAAIVPGKQPGVGQ